MISAFRGLRAPIIADAGAGALKDAVYFIRVKRTPIDTPHWGPSRRASVALWGFCAPAHGKVASPAPRFAGTMLELSAAALRPCSLRLTLLVRKPPLRSQHFHLLGFS
ncbi:hypothetical protein APY04_1363 [Hyphomicrobium sulfonivorans]|uniref:Uncharacterized protein n=1 Tax=Hyphomicrobium sulfonivorans TaxID=121290 RepID=A0A120CWF5_HYPSL|nr:hypothetical protein APY04_1363 [Hyphomicrobium sulfonivorans]